MVVRVKSRRILARFFAVAANLVLLRNLAHWPRSSAFLQQVWLRGILSSGRSSAVRSSCSSTRAGTISIRCSSQKRYLSLCSLPSGDSFASAGNASSAAVTDLTSEWGSDALMQRLSPADVLLSAPKFQAVTSLLTRIRKGENGEERLQEFIRKVILQLESGQKDLISLWVSADTDVLPSEAHVALDEFLQLFDATRDVSMQLTRRDGSRLEGSTNGSQVSLTLKRCDEPEPWLLYSSWMVDSGPPSLLGMRVVAVDRGPDDDNNGENFNALDVKAGDVMYLATVDRAALYGILEWDMLPELTSGFANLIKISDAQDTQGGVVVGQDSILDMLDNRTQAAVNFWMRLNLLPSDEAKVEARQQRLMELTTLTQVLDRAKRDPEISELVAAVSAQTDALYNASHNALVRDIPVENGEVVNVEINLFELIGGIIIFVVVVLLLTQNFGSPSKTDDMPLYSLGGVATQQSQ